METTEVKLNWTVGVGNWMTAKYKNISVTYRTTQTPLRAGFRKPDSWEWGFNSDFSNLEELENYIITHF